MFNSSCTFDYEAQHVRRFLSNQEFASSSHFEGVRECVVFSLIKNLKFSISKIQENEKEMQLINPTKKLHLCPTSSMICVQSSLIQLCHVRILLDYLALKIYKDHTYGNFILHCPE